MTEEKTLLSQIIKNNDIFHSLKITVDNFTDTKNKLIFKTITDLIKKGVKADIQSIHSEINDYAEYIAGLTSFQTSANYKYFETKILEHSRKRKFLELSKSIVENIKLESSEMYKLIQVEIADIVQDNIDDYKIHKIGELLTDFNLEIEERRKNRGAIPGLSTGFEKVDLTLLGFEKRKFYVIGARASQGKSAIMLNFAVCIAQKYSVGFISLESGHKEVLNRIISSVGHINTRNLRTGYFGEAEFSKINHACSLLYDSKLYIYDKPNITLEELEIQAARMAKDKKVDILFIDYLQLVKAKGDSRIEKVSNISIAFKEIARQYNIPVVCAAQLRRDAENRRPGLNDLSDSSQIEKDADCVILIYEKNDEHTLIVAKNRDGEKKDIPIIFNKSYVRFEDKS